MQGRQLFDDGLVRSDDAVDHQAHTPLGRGDDDHLLEVLGRAGAVQQVPQAQEGDQALADVEEGVAGGVLGQVRGQFHDLVHGGEGDDIAFVRRFHQQPVDDGQRERQAERDRGAMPRFALHLDRAAQAVDRLSDHIHPDATARQFGHLGRGRKARLEDQAEERLVVGRRALGQQAVLDRAGQDRVAGQAAAVVGQADHHLGPGIPGPEPDFSLTGLAHGDAFVRVLQPVVGGVADDMHQRLGQPLHHGLVQLGLFPLDLEGQGAAQLAGQVVDQPLEPAGDGPDRGHADRHGGVPHARDEALDILGHGDQAGVVQPGRDLDQPRLGDDEFTDAVHQVVQPFGGHAHQPAALRRGRLARLGRRGGGFRGRFRGLGGCLAGIAVGDCRAGGVVGCAVTGQGHVQPGVVEHEDVSYVVLLDRCVEGRGPAEVERVRLDLVQRGQGIGMAPDVPGAQIAQVVQHDFGLAAQRQGVLRQREGEVPVAVTVVDLCERGVWSSRFGRVCRAISATQMIGQLRQDRVATVGAGGLQQVGDVVAGGQADGDQVRVDPDGPVAHRFKGRFEIVQETGDVVPAEHRARPLERVQVAEHRVDQRLIARCVPQGQQLRLEAFDQPLGLGGENGLCVVVHHGCTSRPMTPSSFCWSKGFTIQPMAPAARALDFRSSALSVDRNTMGTP